MEVGNEPAFLEINPVHATVNPRTQNLAAFGLVGERPAEDREADLSEKRRETICAWIRLD